MGGTRFDKVKTVLRVTSGNFLEMYDFFLFGIYARQISHTFFPNDDPYASLMATFLSFARRLCDAPDRRAGARALHRPHRPAQGPASSRSAIMACGTILIAFVPGYATIGVLAPMLVVLGRLLQGFSAGVELGGVSVYLSEMATPGNKGFYVSWQSASQQVAVVFAALLGYAIANLMPPRSGRGLGLAHSVLHRLRDRAVPLLHPPLARGDEGIRGAQSPPDDAADLRHARRRLAPRARRRGVGDHDHRVVLSHHRLHADLRPARAQSDRVPRPCLATMAIAVSNFIWLPISGAVSDRIGRKPILRRLHGSRPSDRLSGACLAGQRADFGKMLAVELWLSLIYAWYNGAMVVALTELIPASVRTSGFSLAYSLATTLGGSSLLISTWLIQHTGDKAAPGYWMSFAALCGLIATLALYRRRTDDRELVGKPLGA